MKGYLDGGRPQEDGIVRYGDKISIKHKPTNRFLSSTNENYEGGSNQQKVFTVEGTPDIEGTWSVLPPPVTKEQPGYEVGWDDPVRLKHVPTRANLHSHFIVSPVSQQQEVSCLGNDDSNDDNDIWIVEKFYEVDPQYDLLWRVNQPFLLRHKATGKILHSHDVALENGKNEVTGFDTWEENSQWVVNFD